MLHASTRVYGNFSPMGRAFGCGARCWDEPQGPALGETSVTRVSVNHSAARWAPPYISVSCHGPLPQIPGTVRMGPILALPFAIDNPKSPKKVGA